MNKLNTIVAAFELATKYLYAYDLLNLYSVSKFLRRANVDRIVQLIVDDGHLKSTRSINKFLHIFRGVKELTLSNVSKIIFNVRPIYLFGLVKLSLQDLNIEHSLHLFGLHEDHHSFPGLRFLKISRCQYLLNNETIYWRTFIASFPNVINLMLEDSMAITNEILTIILQSMPYLQKLSISKCLNIIEIDSDDGALMKCLRSIKVDKCPRFTKISSFNNILFCDISYTGINSSSLECIIITNKFLKICIAKSCFQITSLSIVSSSLTSLDFELCNNLHDGSFHCPQLTTICLLQCYSLQSLAIISSKISFINLTMLPRLAILSLRCPVLQTINLNGCGRLRNVGTTNSVPSELYQSSDDSYNYSCNLKDYGSYHSLCGLMDVDTESFVRSLLRGCPNLKLEEKMLGGTVFRELSSFSLAACSGHTAVSAKKKERKNRRETV